METDGWEARAIATPDDSRLPGGAEAVIERAGRLGRDEIARLDAADQIQARFRLVAWDVLRDRLAHGEVGTMRMIARNRAWSAVNESLRSFGVDPLPNNGYWRVTTGPGWGAARAARFAACVHVAPELLESDIAEMLLSPWLTLERDVRLAD